MAAGAKVIWILFGNMSGFEEDIARLKNAYRAHRSVVEGLEYTLGIPERPQTQRSLKTLLVDVATRALVWHSHGAYNSSGEPKGHLVDRNSVEVKPSDVDGRRNTLEFAALFGCGIAKSEAMLRAWKRALGLDRYAGSNGSVEGRMYADTGRTWFWGKRYSSGRFGREPAAQKFAQYEFPVWMKKIAAR